MPDERYDLPDGVMDEVARLAKKALMRELGTEEQADAAPDSPVSIKTMTATHTAVVRVQCTPFEIGDHMGTIIPEVFGYLQQIGATLAGPPFSRFYEVGETIDFEAGFPVVEAVEGNARIKAGKLPGGKTATLTHLGPYQELSRSYGVLEEWFKDRDHEVGEAKWEVYMTDPGVEPDPQKWRSLIYWSIK